jgi:hypothetical protein
MAIRRQGGAGWFDRHTEVICRLVDEAGVPEAERVAYAGFCSQLYFETRRVGARAARQVRAAIMLVWMARGLDDDRLRYLAGRVMSAATWQELEA